MVTDPREAAVQVRHDAPDTSNLAAALALPKTGSDRWNVLLLIERHRDGLTDEEIQDRLRLPANSERPRRRELVAGGWLQDSSRRRPSASGNPSIVWELTADGVSAFRSIFP